jgi:hypothetical protein
MTTTIEQKLDTLAEFYAQKDALELSKRDLLNEVKIPDEVLKVMNDGNKRAQEYEANQRHAITKINEECDAKLKEIVIPDEIKKALAEIDRQRALVEAYRSAKARSRLNFLAKPMMLMTISKNLRQRSKKKLKRMRLKNLHSIQKQKT